MRHGFTLWHWFTLLGLHAIFTVLTYLATNSGLSKGYDHDKYVWRATACAVAGPYVGAVARGGQRDCVDFGTSLLKYVGAALGFAVVIQLLPLTREANFPVIRLALWCVAWLAWYASGIVSLLFALS
jgi:hypothetical protein